MMCSKCGTYNAEGTTYCTNCGTTVSAISANVYNEQPSYDQNAATPQPQSYSQPQQTYSQPQPYSQPQVNNYYPSPAITDETVSVGEWMLMTLVFMLPVVGLIMLFVWAFGGGVKKSKANYCKAALIWSAILIAIYILFFIIVVGAMGVAFSEFI